METALSISDVFSYPEVVEACRTGASIVMGQMQISVNAEPVDIRIDACNLARSTAETAFDDCMMAGMSNVQSCVENRLEVQR